MADLPGIYRVCLVAGYPGEDVDDGRNPDLLGGKCGLCEFKKVCGGCRARAYGMTMAYLDEEPFCTYEPAALRRAQVELEI